MKTRTLMRSILYVVLFLALTAAFFVINMPGSRFAGQVNLRLARLTQGQVSVKGASFGLPLALLLDGVTLHTSAGGMSIGKVTLRPSLLSIFAGKMRLRGSASGQWGEGEFSLAREGSNWEGEIGKMDVGLSGLSAPRAIPLDITGRLKVTGTGTLAQDGGGVLDGNGTILGSDVRVEGRLLEALGAGGIHISSLQVTWRVESNLLTVGDANFEGDLIGSLRGTVRLVPSNPVSSRMDLNLSVRPAPEALGRLSSAMAVMGAGQRPETGVTVRLRGTIARPSISL